MENKVEYVIKEIKESFHKKERYFWIAVLSVSTFFTSWLYQTDPTFRFLVFSPVNSSLEWIGYFIFTDFVFASLFTILLGALFGFGLLVGMAITPARRGVNNLRTGVIDAKKILTGQLSREVDQIHSTYACLDIQRILYEFQELFTKKSFDDELGKSKKNFLLKEVIRDNMELRKEWDEVKQRIGNKSNYALEYPCDKCGHPFKAIPRDEGYKVNSKPCKICYWNNTLMSTIYKCERCEYQNIKYSHESRKHSLIEHISASVNRFSKKV